MPIRVEPTHKSEMVTQLLFGDTYQIIDQVEGWLKVKADFDNYIGWLDAKLHHDLIQFLPNNITSGISNLVGEVDITIPAGCFLQIDDSGLVNINNTYKLEIRGSYVPINQSTNSKLIVQIANTYLGTPYLWGGKTHFGIDCSGFMQQTFKICGYNLQRDAYQQACQGKEVIFDDSAEGDLAFFGEGERITHVGMVLEGNAIIHAHGEVRIDELNKNGILNKKNNKLTHTLKRINRILEH